MSGLANRVLGSICPILRGKLSSLKVRRVCAAAELLLLLLEFDGVSQVPKMYSSWRRQPSAFVFGLDAGDLLLGAPAPWQRSR